MKRTCVFITEDDFQLYRIVKLLIFLQGSDETPGLAALTLAEILSMAEKAGKLISISSYEVYQDHVYDLLDPKRPEVMALEDARGKIQLKGLSQVKIYGIFEHFSFINLITKGRSMRKVMECGITREFSF